MKIYQMTQEQIDLLSNDLVGVLQEISKVSLQLQELNDKNKELVKDSEAFKLKDITNKIEYLSTALEVQKNELNDDFVGIENIFFSLKEYYQQIESLNTKLDKKYSHFSKFTPSKSGQNNWLLLCVGSFFGTILTTLLFALVYGDNFIPYTIEK